MLKPWECVKINDQNREKQEKQVKGRRLRNIYTRGERRGRGEGKYATEWTRACWSWRNWGNQGEINIRKTRRERKGKFPVYLEAGLLLSGSSRVYNRFSHQFPLGSLYWGSSIYSNDKPGMFLYFSSSLLQLHRGKKKSQCGEGPLVDQITSWRKTKSGTPLYATNNWHTSRERGAAVTLSQVECLAYYPELDTLITD